MTTSMTCSTTQSASPSSAWIRRTRSTAAAVSAGVSPDMASSSRSRRGSVASARAISSRFLSARVRFAASPSAFGASPVNSRRRPARARASPTRFVRLSAPQTTFSSTVIRPKVRTSCQVRAIPSPQTRSGRAWVTSAPAKTIRPASGWR